MEPKEKKIFIAVSLLVLVGVIILVLYLTGVIGESTSTPTPPKEPKEINYKVGVKAIGTNCDDYPTNPVNLQLSLNNEKTYPVFQAKTQPWILDTEGYLYTVVGDEKYYLGNTKNETVDPTNNAYFTYSLVEKESGKAKALKLDRKSILNNGYDPKLKPIYFQGILYPGGGNPIILTSDTCTGYYVYFEKINQ